MIILGVLTKLIVQKISRNKRGRFTCAGFQRAVEETEGCRGDRGSQRGQRAVEEIEGRREDKEP